jgi:(E)-4-hydroxy-3-methyl-but-2-enyl pyrophosphate reductase
MPFEVAKSAGFCVGVRRAFDQAKKAAIDARKAGISCYSLGELIHNPEVVSALEAEGIIPIQSAPEAKGGILILRSHGVSPDVVESCELNGISVVDCTCPYVKSIHLSVSDYSQNGKPVIIVGDAAHPEVIGIAGWCHGPVHVVSQMEQIAFLPPIQEALAVVQTTFPPSQWQAILVLLKEQIPQITVKTTICSATDTRQTEALELASRCDCMIVVGGKNSANTRMLFETCKNKCSRTILVERAADIPSHFADINKDKIGIAAGASTPDWSLKEVVSTMNDMKQNDQTVTPEAVHVQTEAPVMVEVTADAPAVLEAATEAPAVLEAATEAPAIMESTAAASAVPEVKTDTPAVQKPKKVSDDEKRKNFMADIDATIVRIRTGQTITGTVVQITEDEISVNIGYKSDGMIKRADLVDTDIKLGDEIDVEVVKVNDGEGNVLLSQRNVINRKSWDALMAKYEAGEYVEGVGKEAVKGGLIAMVDGVRAFVPASQLAQRYVEKIGQFVDQKMRLKIIEVDKAKKRIVASRKEVIAEESASKKTAAWEKIKEGDVITGIVRRFADFGAFVDLGGVDGLIHITDLSWSRVGHPSEILTINQEVTVKVGTVDRERERIQLGYKQLKPKPWDNIEEKYPIGTVLERTVVRIRPFGAFIELEPGVDGLVHISQCSLVRVAKVEDALTVGQLVKVKVLAVDTEAKRISLSVKEVLKDEAFNYSDEIPGEEATKPEAVEEAFPAPAE